MVAVLQPIGRAFLGGLEAGGRLSIFAGGGVIAALKQPYYHRLILRQMIEIGFYSLPVVGLTAIFTGMVLALQSFTGFSRFSAESAIPNVVVLSICRELGPVLAGLMVAGEAASVGDGLLMAARAIDRGDARRTLDQLAAISTGEEFAQGASA